jgi:hypothetical protein
VRLLTQLDLTLDTRTRDQIRAVSADVLSVAPERIRAELVLALADPNAHRAVALLAELGLLPYILPETAALVGSESTRDGGHKSPFQLRLDVTRGVAALRAWLVGDVTLVDAFVGFRLPDWTLTALDSELGDLRGELGEYLSMPVGGGLTRADMLAWLGLFHQPGMRHGQDPRHTVPERRLDALRFPREATEFVVAGVRGSALFQRTEAEPALTTMPGRRAIFEYYDATGDAGLAGVLLLLVGALADQGMDLSVGCWREMLTSARALIVAYLRYRDEIVDPEPWLTGHQLLALGVPEGPAVGRALRALRLAQASGAIRDRQQAQELARRLAVGG